MSNWLHAVNGNFNTKHDWRPHAVPGSADDAILNAAGAAFTVTATTNEDVNSLQTAANATLLLKGDPNIARTFTVEDGTANGVNAGAINVGDNATLQLLATIGGDKATFVNSGTISLNAKTGNSFLEVESVSSFGHGSLYLEGGGGILMSDNAGNGIVDTRSFPEVYFEINNYDNTISGAGVIGNGGLANGREMNLENRTKGVIDATGTNNALILDMPSNGSYGFVLNEGLIEGTGKAGLDIAATTVANSGAIFAGDGSIVRLESASIQGGTLASAGTGVILVSGGSTIDGTFGAVTNTAVLQDFGEMMYAQGPITNSGSIRLSDEVTGAVMQVGGAGLTLTGAGTVTLTDNFQNGIQGDGSGSALVNTDNTISGAGTVGGNQLGLTNAGAGVIDATGTFNPLILYGPGLTFTNSGLIETTGSGGLNVAAVTLDQSSGGRLTVASGSVLRLESANLVGGTLTNATGGQIEASGGSALSGTAVTNAGLFDVVEADTLSAAGSIANGGTLSLAGTSTGAHLLLTGTLTLGGGGSVLLGNGGSIGGAQAVDTFTNVNNTIIGDGELGGFSTIILNETHGVIDETGTGGLLIDAPFLSNTGRIVAAGAGGVSVLGSLTNSGIIEANTGSMMSLTGAVINNVVLEANGGTLIAYQAVTGPGGGKITGGTLEFMKAFNQAVTFTGKSGRLDLAKSQGYTQTVSGFSATGGTSFDLGDIKFVSAGEATFSGTATGGTLTVTDGTHTAHIALAGDYLASSFVASRDGSGGVTITASAAPATISPPHAFIAAMAGLGGGSGTAIHIDDPARAGHPAMLAVPRMALA